MATPEELLAAALKGDATAAARLWRSIADGSAGDAVTVAWARDVARLVVAQVIDADKGTPGNRRAEAARRAIGLEGPIDRNAELAEVVEQMPGAPVADVAWAASMVGAVESDGPKVERAVRHIRGKARKKSKSPDDL